MKSKSVILLTTVILVLVSSLVADQNLSEGEIDMGSYTIVQKPPIIVVGIECRTSNAPEAASQAIPRLWGRFFSEDIMNQVPDKVSNYIIALYCDYDGDCTQPYSLVIGCPVSATSNVPHGMVAKIIPGGAYAVFNAVGEFPKSVIETWGTIWQTDLERTYTGDYEFYGDQFVSGSPQEVGIYIAIEQEPKLPKIDDRND